ncbi:MAG TPA: NADH:flavin oxidoreductase [Bacteroidales bacterium]|nr:NADH:flavin oxidoreductase [Bacteroidales bacterium]
MVFETAEIGSIKLKNRIIRSATHEGLADEAGYPTGSLLKKYEVLARNDVGCIITGFAGIMQNGKSNSRNMLMIHDDSYIDSYAQITQKIHEYQTPVILQIVHCGSQTRSKVTGFPTVAPTAIRNKSFNETLPKELSEQEIIEIILNFTDAIVRAKKAGFDGVQLHIAHGFLLSEFLSSYSNRRTDKWGGTTENKFRIIREILDQAKFRVEDFPVLVKLNAHDGRRGGMTLAESVEIAQMLEKSGCAAIEVSCGVHEDGLYTVRGDILPVDAAFRYNFRYKSYPKIVKGLAKQIVPLLTKKIKPYTGYNIAYAYEIRKNVSIPVIVVGGIRSIAEINKIISEKKADFVSMSKPFIIEPNIVKKFKDGAQPKSRCIDCNYCTIAAEEESLKCYYGRLKK